MEPIKRARLDAGISQQAVAEAARCSIAMVRQVENGVGASDDMRARLAQAVGATPAALWPGSA